MARPEAGANLSEAPASQFQPLSPNPYKERIGRDATRQTSAGPARGYGPRQLGFPRHIRLRIPTVRARGKGPRM